MTKREKISDDELQSICREFTRRALGVPDGEVGVVRDRNLRAYNAQPVAEFAPPEIEDRSQYVANDVAETVDGMLPQLLDVFVADDNALQCVPSKPDVPPSPQNPQGTNYTQLAKDASGYLNYLFYTKNDGLNVLYDWIHDALLQKVGFCKVWATQEEDQTREEFSGLVQPQVAMLEASGYTLTKVQQAPDQTFAGVAIKKSKRWEYHTVVVPPYEMRIDPNARWGAEPNAIGHVCNKPRFELEELGYDVQDVAGIGSSVSDLQYAVEANDMLGDIQGDAYTSEVHESHMLYEYAELYLKLDVAGDGIAQWQQCCLINGIMVHHEPVDDHPFAEICLMPRPHAYFGDCPADRAYDIQREHTNLTRALLDNTYLSVNQRTFVNTDAQVNVDDLLDSRPGGIVRGRGDPRNALMPIPTQGVAGEVFNMHEFLQNDLENRTGFTRYSQGLDSDSLNKTATGVSTITEKSDMRLRLMSRFAASGIKKMFRKLLKLATQNQDEQDWYAVNGEFTPVNPSEWKDQFNITINVGLGHGTKQQRAQRVMAMLPLQMQGLNLGIVQPEQIANTIRLFAQVNEFRNPAQFVNAQTSGPPPQMLQQHMQQMQQQLQQSQQQLQSVSQENMMLKAHAAARQGELSIRQQELQIKAQQAGADIGHKAHVAALDDAKAQHEHAAAQLDNASNAHAFGVNQGLGQAEVEWQQQLAAAHQIAQGVT